MVNEESNSKLSAYPLKEIAFRSCCMSGVVSSITMSRLVVLLQLLRLPFLPPLALLKDTELLFELYDHFLFIDVVVKLNHSIKYIINHHYQQQ
jgi:hypothetical protein